MIHSGSVSCWRGRPLITIDPDGAENVVIVGGQPPPVGQCSIHHFSISDFYIPFIFNRFVTEEI